MTRCLGDLVFMAKIVARSFRRAGGFAVFVIV